MYVLPGYTGHYTEGNDIYVYSKLLHNKVKLTDPAIKQEFQSIVHCGGCAEISTPLTKLLHEQELLLTKTEIQHTLETTRQMLNDTFLLTIMPTEGCNFRCPYCYEDHAPISMTRRMLDQLQAFIVDQVPHFRFVNINWFGGEPTLCKDTILETSSIIQSLQSKYNFQYSASMTTNGYLLNEECFIQFYEGGITNFQITLDGWDHDSTRPHVSGKGTLHAIINNLISLSALPCEKYQFHVILRHNILANDEDYTWYDYLYTLFGADDRFEVSVVPVDNWGGDSVQSLNLIEVKQRKDLVAAHISYLDKIGMSHEKKNDSLFSNICYASYPHGFVFRANGKIEKCTIAQNHPKNLVGQLSADKGVILDEPANYPWYNSSLKPECYMCPDVLSCFNLRCKRYSLLNGHKDFCPSAKTHSN